MRQSEERYISLLTDFGFKRIFGTDPNKELLVNFLNSLFDGEEVIKDVKYLNSENVGDVSLKAYRDIKNSLDTAKEEGREEGRAEGRAEGIAMVVKNMHAKGMDIDVIASITGLNKDEVESLCL